MQTVDAAMVHKLIFDNFGESPKGVGWKIYQGMPLPYVFQGLSEEDDEIAVEWVEDVQHYVLYNFLHNSVLNAIVQLHDLFER
jgi:hypothetical protein